MANDRPTAVTQRADDTAALAETVATACRVMARVGLVEHVLGHISARISDDEVLLRCRGRAESGLAYTTADDVRRVPLTGSRDLGDWTAPNEAPIHTEIMRRRPGVTAVVHAHPPAVVALSLTGTALLPIYGAYDIPGARLAADGIPTWDRSVLITNRELAGAMADCARRPSGRHPPGAWPGERGGGTGRDRGGPRSSASSRSRHSGADDADHSVRGRHAATHQRRRSGRLARSRWRFQRRHDVAPSRPSDQRLRYGFGDRVGRPVPAVLRTV